MNLEQLNRKLLAAARANPPSDRVPYAFEKRVLAHLSTRPVVDVYAAWSRALWRASAPCVAVALLAAAWTFVSPETPVTDEAQSVDIESTLLAQFDNSTETW